MHTEGLLTQCVLVYDRCRMMHHRNAPMDTIRRKDWKNVLQGLGERIAKARGTRCIGWKEVLHGP